jgi:hypothetical protein
MAWPEQFYPSTPGGDTTGPVQAFVAITPSDTADFTYGESRGLHVNVAGNIAIVDGRGNTVTLTVVAGMPLPYAARRVLSTGTTATGIFALY